MNESNLKSFQKGEERARKAGRKGGVASGEARRERVRDLLQAELDREHENMLGAGMGLSRRAKMVQKLVDKAASGDMKALQLVLKLTGEDGAESDAGSVSEA